MKRAATNLQLTVIGAAVLAVLGGVLWFGVGRTQPLPTDAATGSDAVPVSGAVSESRQAISIHVSGAVIAPGVVDLPTGSRAAAAIAAAGGATPDADLGRMNLAAPLRDGEHIIVPSIADIGDAPENVEFGVDVNQATASELESLPGVGPVLAARIVSFRADNGPFRAVEDLLDVAGIGEAKLNAMRDLIARP
jgi:competence protein ComEA